MSTKCQPQHCDSFWHGAAPLLLFLTLVFMWLRCHHRTPEFLRHGRSPRSSGHQLPSRGERRIQRSSVQLQNHLSHHRGKPALSLLEALVKFSACHSAGCDECESSPQMKTLRGSILEESVPSAARHTTPRGLSPKRLLEFIMPELNLHCLRLASNSPKVRDTLLKLDEQGVSKAASADAKYCCMCQAESIPGRRIVTNSCKKHIRLSENWHSEVYTYCPQWSISCVKMWKVQLLYLFYIYSSLNYFFLNADW